MSGQPAVPNDPLNRDVAAKLDEVAALLEEQRVNPFRVQAYRNAAATVRGVAHGIDEILDDEGCAGLDRLPGIGPALTRVIEEIVRTGRLTMLDRLRAGGGEMASPLSRPRTGALRRRRSGRSRTRSLRRAT